MRSNYLTHPIRQLFLVFAGFAVAIVLLESEGLAKWASHLEIGPLRSVAVPVTAAVQSALQPLGIYRIRDRALDDLARVGWTDDPALLEKAANTVDLPRLQPSPAATTAACAATPPKLPAKPAPLHPNPSIVAISPLATDVPHTTVLPALPPVEPGKQRVVALAGDSMMAVGLSATLLRQAASHKNLRMVKVFRSGTGLARPEVFDWMDEYPAMLGDEKPDVVIVAIGANDGQGFVVDGKVLPYGSENWRKVYQQRLADYLAMVGAGGARVVWVGLPPMRLPVYNEKTAAINRIAFTVVSQSPQATWWNPVSYVGDEAGNFREFATQTNGQTVRLRSTDGIHLSDEGAGLLSAVLITWLDPPSPAAASSGPAAPSPVAEPKPAARPKRRVKRALAG
jgi:hypothetical protein